MFSMHICRNKKSFVCLVQEGATKGAEIVLRVIMSKRKDQMG